MQWLRKIADDIERRNPDGEILIESGGSPSGTHHFGHLRELITSDAVLQELKTRGRAAKHIYFVDDLDGLRKIPVDIPQEFEKYLGKPLCDIPAPDGSDGSFASFFIQGLKDAAKSLGLELDFIHSHEKYRDGFFIPAIEKSLERINDGRKILETISGHKLGEEWSPIQVNEDGYLKKRAYLGIDTESKTLKYKDRDDEQRTISYAQGAVKLDWRLDWPGRWWLLKVDAEPFGRDHATKGGSYDTGEALMKEVYGALAPLPIPYDFVNLAGDTKKMSASKGTGLSAEEIVKALPPEIIRYFMLRYSPLKRLYFDPENGVSRLIDEYAVLLSKTEKTADENRLIEICSNGINPTVSSIPFSLLRDSYQAAGWNKEQTIEVLSRNREYGEKVSAESSVIQKQLDFIHGWLDSEWAPEDVKFNIEENNSHLTVNFSEKEMGYLQKLADKINEAPNDADGEWFHKAIYTLKESDGLTPKEVFTPLYMALINKSSGPRAGWFLSDLYRTRGKEWLVKHLHLEA
jgi:lysyl-tRNA synthetase class 1